MPLRAFTYMGACGNGQDQDGQSDLRHCRPGPGLSKPLPLACAPTWMWTKSSMTIGKGSRPELADGQSREDHGRKQLTSALPWTDAQGSGLVLAEAQRNGARLPVTALVDQFYADVQAMGGKSLGYLQPDPALALSCSNMKTGLESGFL